METVPTIDESPRPTITLTSADWRPKLDAYCPSLVAAREACALFIATMAADPEGPGYWLTLSGKFGSGKTMLAEQLFAQAKRLNPDEAPVIIYRNYDPDNPPQRRRTIRTDERAIAQKMRGVDGDTDLPERYARGFFVLLDELGATRDPTLFAADAVARLLQGRMDKWTVICTNLTVAEIADRIDARIASRLIRDSNVFLTIEAGDYALYTRRQLTAGTQAGK